MKQEQDDQAGMLLKGELQAALWCCHMRPHARTHTHTHTPPPVLSACKAAAHQAAAAIPCDGADISKVNVDQANFLQGSKKKMVQCSPTAKKKPQQCMQAT